MAGQYSAAIPLPWSGLLRASRTHERVDPLNGTWAQASIALAVALLLMLLAQMLMPCGVGGSCLLSVH